MMACAISSIFLVVVLLVSGYRQAPPISRLRLRWIIAATLILLVTTAIAYLTPLALSLLGGMVDNAVLALCYACYVYGVLRYRLVDLSIVIDRTLVYGGVTALVVGAIAAVNSLALRIALPPGAGLLLQVVVPLSLGITLNKLRSLMDRVVEQVFFRRKYLTEQALRGFARRTGHIDRAQDLLDATVREVSRNLSVPAVVVYSAESHGFRRMRQAGDRDYPVELGHNDDAVVEIRATGKATDLARLSSALGTDGCVFPMLVLGNLRGLLVVENRPGERFGTDERVLLAAVAQDVGAAWRILRARENESLVAAMAAGTVAPDAAFAQARKLSWAWTGS